MAEIAFVNGEFVPRAQATVSIDDRGLVLADSVYEVILVASARPVDMGGHLARLQRSMAALMFPSPPANRDLKPVILQLIRHNAVEDGMVYLQIGRGTATRDLTPHADLVPSVIVTTRPRPIHAALDLARAMDIATMPDIRWGRCDIKTTALVPGVLARLGAQARGCGDAWLVDRDGFITEGCASNAWIVRNGTVTTRPLGPEILAGVTRDRVMKVAESCGISIVAAKFSVADCLGADEAFMTSATALVTPVRTIDGVTIGSGAPGPLTARLYQAYLAFVRDPEAKVQQADQGAGT
jgi:D-alanine transaminase